MNSIFGDATTAAPTPQTLAEAESLFSRSPVPSFRLADGEDGGRSAPQDANIPDLDIEPPVMDTEDGKPLLNGGEGEGAGGWISNLVRGNKGSANGRGSVKYRRVGQEEE